MQPCACCSASQFRLAIRTGGELDLPWLELQQAREQQPQAAMGNGVALSMDWEQEPRGARGFAVRQQRGQVAALSGKYFQREKFETAALGAIGNQPPAPLLDQRLAQRLIPDARRGSSVLSESAL